MDFYQRIAGVCKLIPAGKVATYGQIALLCERPQNSRQVGVGLNRKMSEPVPAHRVVNHQGFLSGAPAFEQPEMQKLLLEGEGIEVTYVPAKMRFRVDVARYQWRPAGETVREIKEWFAGQGI